MQLCLTEGKLQLFLVLWIHERRAVNGYDVSIAHFVVIHMPRLRAVFKSLDQHRALPLL
jgi:hypothetical protein